MSGSLHMRWVWTGARWSLYRINQDDVLWPNSRAYVKGQDPNVPVVVAKAEAESEDAGDDQGEGGGEASRPEQAARNKARTTSPGA